MKIGLKHGIIAAVVMSAMSGCTPEPEVYVNSVSSVEECVQGNLGTTDQCSVRWGEAKEENARTGPRFEDSADCTTEFGSCEKYNIQHENGTQSSVFIPMMMGMMMGNMMSNSSVPVSTQPLYRRESDKRYGTNSFITASGATVFRGSSSVTPSSVRTSTPATMSKGTSFNSVSRGGFGGIGGKSGGLSSGS